MIVLLVINGNYRKYDNIVLKILIVKLHVIHASICQFML